VTPGEAGPLLGLLGLGRRAGRLTIGTSAVRAALQRDALALVVLADDRSARTEEKVARLARARGVPMIDGPDAATLGAHLGLDAVQTVGLTDPRLAEGIMMKYSSSRAGGQRGE